MNQMLGGSAKDGARKRREYLLKKAMSKTFVAVGVAIITAVALGWMQWLVLSKRPISLPDDIPATLFWFFVPAMILFLAVWLCVASVQRVQSHRYVPPVHEQISALPADEVLLRGSDVPAAAPTELLRAAREVTAESPEELLRAEGRTE